MPDKEISEKVAKLIKEGKPQKQAIAIALSMKRRGDGGGMSKAAVMARHADRQAARLALVKK